MSLPTAPAGPPGEIDWPEAVIFGLAVGQWLFGLATLTLFAHLLAGVATALWLPVGSGALAILCFVLRRLWLKAHPQGVVLAMRLALAGALALGSVWSVFKALGRLL
jgi:hypothetical protein